MTDRTITIDMLLAFIKPAKSYQMRMIAAGFGVTSEALRPVLEAAIAEGVVDTLTSNGVHLYRLPERPASASAMKPLKISREMRAAQERCGELRVHPSRFHE